MHGQIKRGEDSSQRSLDAGANALLRRGHQKLSGENNAARSRQNPEGHEVGPRH